MRIKHLSGNRQNGQSLVEFALVIPIFLLLLFGLIDLGRLVYINNAISEGAREGTRWGSVQASSPTLNAAGRTAVGTHAKDSMAAVPDPTVSVKCYDKLDPVMTVELAVCGKGDTLVVRVDSPVSMLTPILAQFVGPRTYTAISTTAIN
jgi:Flp pilus assembly protein TadG